MATLTLPIPGLRQGLHAERAIPVSQTPSDRRIAAWLRRQNQGRKGFKDFTTQARAIHQRRESLRSEREATANAAIAQLRLQMRGKYPAPDLLIEAMARIALEVERIFELTLHDQQLFAGYAMLEGRFVEMATGEGKTLTAALPAIIAALAGTPVHIITANDYLVARDEAKLRPLYRRFGLHSAAVRADMNDDRRRLGYAADITYVNSRQVVFDYLRDGLTTTHIKRGIARELGDLAGIPERQLLQRGLSFAIIDEADNALIDEARTPMIIARPLPGAEARATEARIALAIAKTLETNIDFTMETSSRSITLTDTGRENIVKRTSRLTGSWKVPLTRNERIRQALTVLHGFRRDRDYIVRDDAIALIDENSGRILEGRKLQHGLHTVLELHEGLKPTPETEPAAALSFQRFFPRYLHLAGMSGTLNEVAAELTEVYGPVVTRAPTHRPVVRTPPVTSLHDDQNAQFEAALTSIRACIAAGRPVLVGARTVRCSEAFSNALTEAAIPHHLLNARQDADEAAVIARAGEAGSVTVATNMAGRGTDILLSKQARAAGGLHVIALEINDSARVDRQLFGRAGRQGDPGSGESILCAKDELLDNSASSTLIRCLRTSHVLTLPLSRWTVTRVVRQAQKKREAVHARMRQQAFRSASTIERQLAFAGDKE